MVDNDQSADDDVAELYRQAPLGYSGDAVRVLLVRPGTWYQEIKVALKTITLSSTPHYEALSYTWGASTAGRTIIINGSYRISVTDNLFNALRRLRLVASTRVLWVDKVCINQSDLDERGRQVAMMADIYQKATCVNVWLGEPGWTVPFTFRVNAPWRYEFRTWDLRRWLYWLDALRNRPAMMNKAIEATAPRWQDRAWTAQEFVVAKKVYLCYGGVRSLLEFGGLDYGALDVAEALWKTLPALKGLRSRIGYGLHMFQYDLHGGSDSNYLALLERAAELGFDRNAFGILDVRFRLSPGGASDPRDQVYSLLGMIGEDEAAIIGVDYTLPPAKVYSKATYASIKTRNNFDILSIVRLNRTLPELPTWCVDFSSSTQRMRYTNRDPPIQKTCELQTQSRENDEPARNLMLRLDDSYSQLTFSAVAIDEISSRVILRGTGSDHAVTPEMVRNIRSLLRLATVKVLTVTSSARPMIQQDIFGLFSRGPAEYVDQAASIEEAFQWVIEGQHHMELPGFIMQTFRLWTTVLGLQVFKWTEQVQRYAEYNEAIKRAREHNSRNSGGSAIFETSSGLIGLAVEGIEAGDQIVQVRSEAPFIALRPIPDTNTYIFQGHVFVHGLWGDGILDAFERLSLPRQMFTLQ